MQTEAKQRFHQLIMERLSALEASAPENDERAPVTLDQQSVGRLSRMDAMQRQAMAHETARRREAEITRLRAALLRIDDEDFGYCVECGDAIPARRLEIDPSATRCVTCARGG